MSSKTIEQRVLEMRFDNSQFERSVSSTMSTLDKLKQKFNFSGATKSIEQINHATKNVDMRGLGGAVESVSAKFSALQVIGVTALANITNSAINAGKRIMSALTIDPIKTGFSEYETQINAVQTILANTESKGTTIDDVNKALEELNKYADMTIYNFTEMTRNIGTFTAAGVDLNTSVNAIKGIANLAAVSGSTSQQASTAMYQLSQALASGTVKLMDWNSVVNAGMGGEVFQNALKETARVHGIAIDQIIEDEGSFRESLKGGWLTSDILTETLEKFTMATEGATEAEIAANREKLKAIGYTEEQIEEIFKLGNTATNAATKVKTFTQLWDVLKEAAQSGWAQTWKLIIGDFEEAKELLSPLADFLTGIINKISDLRNAIIKSALGKTFTHLIEGFTFVKKTVDGVLEPLNTVSEALEDLGAIADKVIYDSFGNGKERFDALTASGYNFYRVQNKVNETLGSTFRYTEEQIAEQDKLLEAQGETVTKTGEQAAATIKLTEENKKQLKTLVAMSDEQLRNAGYTQKQIDALRELESQAEKLGIPIDEFIDKLDQINGRWLLMNSFKNIGQSLVDVFGAVKAAWDEIFNPGMSEEDVIEKRANALFNLIAGFHKLTTTMTGVIYQNGEFTETGENLVRTLKGVFALVDIIATVTGGAFKFAFGLAKEVLSMFDLTILDVTASIGDAIVKFRDFVDGALDIAGAIEKIAPYIKDAVQNICDWIAGFKDADNIGAYIIEGLVKGLTGGVAVVFDAAVALAKGLWEAFCDFLQIRSPSRKMIEAGEDTIEGLTIGLQNGASKVWDFVKGIGAKLVELVRNIDFGKILAASLGVGILYTINKVANLIEVFSAPFEGLGNMLNGLGSMLDSIGDGIESNLKAGALKKRAKAVLNFALALGVLALSLKVVSDIDSDRLWASVGAIGALAAIATAMSFAITKMGSINKFGKQALTLTVISGAILILALALKALAGIGMEDISTEIMVLSGMILSIAAVMSIFGKLPVADKGKSIVKVGALLISMSIALLAMVAVIKIVSGMSSRDIGRGVATIAAFELLIMAIIAVSKAAGKWSSKAGSMLLKMSIALMIMVGVVKLAAGLGEDEVRKGLRFIAAVETLFAAIIAVSFLAGQHASKAGTMLLLMSGALAIMVFVVKQITDLTDDQIKRGLTVIAGIEVLFAAIIAVSNFAGQNAVKAGLMLLLMSGAMALVAGTMLIISELIDKADLARSLAAVTLIGLIFTAMIAATKNLKGIEMGPLVTLVVAVGIMATAVAALSFIDPKSLATASASLSALMGMFALMTVAVGKLKDTNKLVIKLIPMLAAMAIIGGILSAMSLLPNSDRLIPIAVSLGILLNSMTAALFVLSKVGPNVGKSVGSAALMALVIGELGAILAAMSFLPNPDALIPIALSLSVLITALTASMVVMGLAGPATASAVGPVALMGLVVAEIGAILAALSFLPNPEALLPIALSLSTLLLAISAACLVLGPIGKTGSAAITGVGILSAVVAILGVLAIAIGELMSYIPPNKIAEWQTGITNLMNLLSTLSYGIGKVAGSLVGGFADGAMSGLPAIGTYLSDFITNARGFIDGAKTIDGSVFKGVATLAGLVLALTAVDLVTGVTSLLTFGSSFTDLGTELSEFMTNVTPFIDGASKLKPEMLSGVKTLADVVIALTAANVLEGLTSWFTGGSSLISFGEQLAPLGGYLASFAANLGTFGDDQIASIECAAGAIKAMSEAAAGIPNEGGWLAKLVGDNSIATFGAYLPVLGTNLSSFASNLGTFDEAKIATIDCAARAVRTMAEVATEIPNEGGWLAKLVGDNSIATFGMQLPILGLCLNLFAASLGAFDETKAATITCAANAVKSVAEAAEEIPNSGGWLAKLVGDNNIATFGAQLPGLGTNLAAFATNLGTFDEAKAATVTCAANAIKSIAQVAEDLPNEGGWLAKIFGDNSIGTFSANFGELGTNLAAFVQNLGTFDSAKVSTVNSAVNAIKALATLADADLAGAKRNIEGFGNKLGAFGEDLADFCSKLSGVSSVSDAIDNLNRLIETIQTISESKVSSLAKFGDALKKLGQEAIDSFVSAFTSTSAKTDVEKAAGDLANKAVDGMESKKTDIGDAADTLVSKASSNIKSVSNYNKFYSAGSYLAEGFASGISSSAYKAAAQARAMANAAARAAEEALDINSPSKVFKAIGTSIPEGFALGIGELGSMVKTSSMAMGDVAIDGVRNSISRIASTVTNDIDASPTIRPVMDLGGVKTGVDAINGMLNLGSSIGVNANVGAINTMMSRRNQNGTNDDVVSAIKQLGKHMSNVGGNSYSIGNVTYDDGSAVAEAIQTIARAAVMERRV